MEEGQNVTRGKVGLSPRVHLSCLHKLSISQVQSLAKAELGRPIREQQPRTGERGVREAQQKLAGVKPDSSPHAVCP